MEAWILPRPSLSCVRAIGRACPALPAWDLSARRESNFTGESATARAVRNLFQLLRAERTCSLSVTARANRARNAPAHRAHRHSMAYGPPAVVRARAVQPLFFQAARACGAVACRALDAIEQYPVPDRRADRAGHAVPHRALVSPRSVRQCQRAGYDCAGCAPRGPCWLRRPRVPVSNARRPFRRATRRARCDRPSAGAPRSSSVLLPRSAAFTIGAAAARAAAGRCGSAAIAIGPGAAAAKHGPRGRISSATCSNLSAGLQCRRDRCRTLIGWASCSARAVGNIR
jgi:hypothetical protein